MWPRFSALWPRWLTIETSPNPRLMSEITVTTAFVPHRERNFSLSDQTYGNGDSNKEAVCEIQAINHGSVEESELATYTTPSVKWYRRKRFWAVVILVVATCIAVPIGVKYGIGLNRLPHLAWERSGLVAIDSGPRAFDFFVHRANGDFVRKRFRDGRWIDDTDIIRDISDNAARDLPVMALSYTYLSQLVWRLFFVNRRTGFLEEAIINNSTRRSYLGPLGAGNYTFAKNGIGLTACVNSNFYSYGTTNDGLGIRLYHSVLSALGGIQELIFDIGGAEVWATGHQFANASPGGVECVVRSTPITQVYLEQAGKLQQNWYDASTNISSTGRHPIQTWTAGFTYGNMRQGSAIAAIKANETSFIHFQSDDGKVWQIRADGNAENATLSTPVLVGEALIGTKLTAVILSTSLNGSEIHVFAQTSKFQIVDYVRTLDGDRWAEEIVPIGP